MRRTQHAAALLAAAAILGTACGGSSPDVQDATDVPPVPEGLALLPPDCFGVARVDGAAFRASAHFPVLTQTLANLEQSLAAQDPSRTPMSWDRWLAVGDALYVGFLEPETPGGPPQSAFVLETSAPAAELRELVLAIEDEPGAGRLFQAEQRPEGEVFVSERRHLEAVISGSTVLAAPPSRLPEMRARKVGSDTSTPISSNRDLSSLAERVAFDESMVAVVSRVTASVKEQLTRVAEDDEQRAAIQTLVSIGGHLDVPGSLDLQVVAVASDASVPPRVVERLQGQLAGLARNPMVNMFGFGPLLRGTELSADGDAAVLRTRISQEDVGNLLGRMEGFLTMALQAAMGGARPGGQVHRSPRAALRGSRRRGIDDSRPLGGPRQPSHGRGDGADGRRRHPRG